MTARNEHTGRRIKTKYSTKEYRDNYAIVEANRKRAKAGNNSKEVKKTDGRT